MWSFQPCLLNDQDTISIWIIPLEEAEGNNILSQFISALCCYFTGHGKIKGNGQFKSLKYILSAFLLRRTKAKLSESGVLLLPPLTEITV